MCFFFVQIFFNPKLFFYCWDKFDKPGSYTCLVVLQVVVSICWTSSMFLTLFEDISIVCVQLGLEIVVEIVKEFLVTDYMLTE